MLTMIKPSNSWNKYGLSIGLVSITCVIGHFVHKQLEPANLVMLYLLAVVLAATFLGRGPSIVASILSVLSFDFFLVPPYLTLAVSDIQYIFTFTGLFIVAIVISTLVSKTREQAIRAQEQESQTAALYRLSKDLASSESFEKVLEAIRENTERIFNCNTCIYLPSSRGFMPVNFDKDFPINEHEKTIATWVFQNGKPAGKGTETLTSAEARYIPLNSPLITVGVLGMKSRDNAMGMTVKEEEFLNAIASQATIAIQRAKLAEESQQIELMRQTEKLQSALLNSISHDLRTPLVSIIGALSSLLQDKTLTQDENRKEVLKTAHEESERLNQLVGNLLDMSRLEAGTLAVKAAPCDFRDILGASLQSLKDKLENRDLQINISQDLPEIPMDYSLMMRVLVNLIDNALKYSPDHSPIQISARQLGNDARIEIRDEGFGVPDDDLKRIFEKFYRAVKPRKITGTGLGLSICKGIVEAHGGSIWAQNNTDKGATFFIELPFSKEN